MELKEARYFLAIAKHQSIGKAAESLYISLFLVGNVIKFLAPLVPKGGNALCVVEIALPHVSGIVVVFPAVK